MSRVALSRVTLPKVTLKRYRNFIIIGLAFFAVFSMGLAIALASQDSMPGTLLYPIKLAV